MPINYDTSSNFALKTWSEVLGHDVLFKEEVIADALNEGVILKKDDLAQGRGDRIRMQYEKRLTGKGVVGDNPKRTAAQSVGFAYDDILIEKLSFPVKNNTKGSISQQRLNIDLDESSMRAATRAMKEKLLVGFFNQLGGNTATTITYDGESYATTDRLQVTGLNSATAPTTYRKLFATGSADETVNAASTATLTLSLIDSAVQEAYTQRSGLNNFKRLTRKNFKGFPYEFLCYVSMAGMTQLLQQAETTSSMNKVTMPSYILSQIAGGNNPEVGTVGSFVYNNTKVIAVPDHYIPNGVHSSTSASQSNVKRALFCGAEAIGLALGQGFNDGGDVIPGFKLKVDPDTFEDINYVSAEFIGGMKKAVVDTFDQSVITISHYVQ